MAFALNPAGVLGETVKRVIEEKMYPRFIKHATEWAKEPNNIFLPAHDEALAVLECILDLAFELCDQDEYEKLRDELYAVMIGVDEDGL